MDRCIATAVLDRNEYEVSCVDGLTQEGRDSTVGHFFINSELMSNWLH